MKIAIALLVSLPILALLGCSGLETANLDNSEIVIDGKHYKVVEVTPGETKSVEDTAPKTVESPNKVQIGRPTPTDDVKYYIGMPDGKYYATRNELTPVADGIIRISEYWLREKKGDLWVFHKEPLDLDKTIAIIDQMRR